MGLGLLTKGSLASMNITVVAYDLPFPAAVWALFNLFSPKTGDSVMLLDGSANTT